jgi:hypothetical protein
VGELIVVVWLRRHLASQFAAGMDAHYPGNVMKQKEGSPGKRRL